MHDEKQKNFISEKLESFAIFAWLNNGHVGLQHITNQFVFRSFSQLVFKVLENSENCSYFLKPKSSNVNSLKSKVIQFTITAANPQYW